MTQLALGDRPAPQLTLRELRVTLAVEDSAAEGSEAILSTFQAIALARSVISDLAQESVLCITLDARHRVTGYSEVARGTLNSARLMPRDVLIPALLSGAGAVILAHNHPSGEVTPSRADRILTSAMRDAFRMVGIPLLDHIIVTRRSHFSFRAEEDWSEGSL
jgi:DNA repair protein RadC